MRFDDVTNQNKATGIDDLVVPGFGTFDVAFTVGDDAFDIYGVFPGDLVPLPPFFGVDGSKDASSAINLALNLAEALGVGEVDGSPASEFYNIGTIAFVFQLGEIGPFESLAVVRSITEGGVDWFLTGENFISYDAEPTTWAEFTPVPEPSAVLSAVAALGTLTILARRRRR